MKHCSAQSVSTDRRAGGCGPVPAGRGTSLVTCMCLALCDLANQVPIVFCSRGYEQVNVYLCVYARARGSVRVTEKRVEEGHRESKLYLTDNLSTVARCVPHSPPPSPLASPPPPNSTYDPPPIIIALPPPTSVVRIDRALTSPGHLLSSDRRISIRFVSHICRPGPSIN
jgi:hypothetical protein